MWQDLERAAQTHSLVLQQRAQTQHLKHRALHRMGAFDFGSLINSATGGQLNQAQQSLQQGLDRGLTDAEIFMIVNLSLQTLATAATFGLFLIALSKYLKGHK